MYWPNFKHEYAKSQRENPPEENAENGGTNQFDSVNRLYRLRKTCRVRSKGRDQYQSDNRETNDKN